MSTSPVEPIDRAARLNRDCHCIAVDRTELEAELGRDLDDPALSAGLRRTHRDLFASFPVFLSTHQLDAMRRVIDAVEVVVASDGHRADARDRLGDSLATRITHPLLGFDFHLSSEPDTAPQLIEVNTNPGGVLLAVYAARAQRACCPEVAVLRDSGPRLAPVEAALVGMMREAAGAGAARVAVVDTDPPTQFLYPEMLLYRRLFERHGLRADVVDPGALNRTSHRLELDDLPLDGVYSRLTDFRLEHPTLAPLRDAWLAGEVGLTPDPWDHARYADKRSLIAWSDPERLRLWGVDDDVARTLVASVPAARAVEPNRADELWAQRRDLFFKPVAGFGSRGAYEGAKLTRKTFERLLGDDYVAQRRVPPSERILVIDGERRSLKTDLRCVVWQGRVLMVLARLYRGQTTNLRTEGGGLATVFVVP